MYYTQNHLGVCWLRYRVALAFVVEHSETGELQQGAGCWLEGAAVVARWFG